MEEGHCSTGSAVERLPTEILRQIFLTAWPRIDVQNPKAFAGRTAAVCSWWWSTIIESPELWCNFDISFASAGMARTSSSTNYLPESLNLLVDLCLLRSKEYLLTIRFHPQDYLASIPSIMTRLLNHSNRWISASFPGPLIVQRSGIFPLPQPFHSLESLTLDEPAGFTILQKPPRLKSLRIASFAIPSPSDLNIPWRQITDLSLTTYAAQADGMFPLWRSLSSMTRLSLTFYGHQPNIAIPDHTPVFLGALTTLEIKMTLLAPAIRAVLGKLRARSLKSLRLVPLPLPGPWMGRDDVSAVVDFLDVSEVQLNRLELADFFDEDSLAPVIHSKSAKTTTRLHLQGCPASFLRQLHLNHDVGDQLLPELEFLTLSDILKRPRDHDLADRIVDMLRSRLPGTATEETGGPDSTGVPFSRRSGYIKQAVIWDTYVVLSRIVAKLRQLLQVASFRWDYRNFMDGTPKAVYLHFPS